MSKWLKIIEGNKTINVTEETNLILNDTETSFPEAESDDVDIKGIDGILPGAINFAPFTLNLEMVCVGVDIADYHTTLHKIRNLFNRRTPYYVVHSDLPGVKYAINTAKVSAERVLSQHFKLTVELNVYKGYSESINTTIQAIDFDSDWFVENNIPLDISPKYHHTSNQFEIWNGSTDTIDPRKGHKLQIVLNVNATGGFKLVNYTTGSVFEYKKSITKDVPIILDKVYAYRDMNRCGIDTNRGVITLAEGRNVFAIKGDVTSQETQFDFPFIYR